MKTVSPAEATRPFHVVCVYPVFDDRDAVSAWRLHHEHIYFETYGGAKYRACRLDACDGESFYRVEDAGGHTVVEPFEPATTPVADDLPF